MPTYSWCNANNFTYFIVDNGTSSDIYIHHDEHQIYYSGQQPSSDVPMLFPGAVPVRLGPMQHYPRMWRGQMHIASRQFGTEEIERSAVRFARMLAEQLRDIFRFVEPDPVHDPVYGHELRSLLILACTEVENSCKAILKANGASPIHPPNQNPPPAWPKTHFNIYDYSRLVAPMKLDQWTVGLSTRPQYGQFKPFDGWTLGGPSPAWWKAYNGTKHDRDGSLNKATLAQVIRAVAAVFVLNTAQFGNHYREIATYFSPDEFVLYTLPQWGVFERYVPQLMVPSGNTPATPMPTSWTPVNYQF